MSELKSPNNLTKAKLPSNKEIIEKYGITDSVSIESIIGVIQNMQNDYSDLGKELEQYITSMQLNSDTDEILKNFTSTVYNFLYESKYKRRVAWCYVTALKTAKEKAYKELDKFQVKIKEVKQQEATCRRDSNELDRKTKLFEKVSQDLAKTSYKTWVELYFQNKLQKLEEDLQTLLQTRNSGIIMSLDEIKTIEEQITTIKAKILATIMAYVETQPDNPIISLKVGEQQINIDCKSKQLLSKLGLLQKINDSTNYSDKDYNFIQLENGELYAISRLTAKVLEKEYEVHIFEGLRNLQIIGLQNYGDYILTLDEFAERQAEYERYDNKVSVLLKRYYNIGNTNESLDLMWLHKSKKNRHSDDAITTVTPSIDILAPTSKSEELSDDEYDMKLLKEKYGEKYLPLVMPIIEKMKKSYLEISKKIDVLKGFRRSVRKNKKGIDMEFERSLDNALTYLNSADSFLHIAHINMLNAVMLKHHREYAEEQTIVLKGELANYERELDESQRILARKADIYEKTSQAFKLAETLLGREKPIISTKVPLRTSPEKYFMDEFQNLQNNIGKIIQTLNLNGKISPSKKKELENQVLKHKIQFLATVMAYSETIPSNQLVSCKIGENKVSLNYLLEQLPIILGLVEKIRVEDKKNYSISDYDFIENEDGKVYVIRKSVKKALVEQYESQIPGKLMNVQLLRIPDYTNKGITNLKGFSQKYGAFEKCKNKLEILLKKYCNIGKVENMLDPLLGLEMVRGTNPDVITPKANTSLSNKISEIVESIKQGDSLLER